MKRKKIHCHNCGAPITTEICFYCKSRTGIDSKDADMPYEVIEIFEAEKPSGNYLITFPFLIYNPLNGLSTEKSLFKFNTVLTLSLRIILDLRIFSILSIFLLYLYILSKSILSSLFS